MAGTLARVREACRAVAEDARSVRIDSHRIVSYVASLPLDIGRPPELDPDHHYLGHGHDTLHYLVMLDSINFGSGYFPHLRKLPRLSGYFTVATRLKWAFERRGPFSAEELARLSPEDCAALLEQDADGGPRDELMRLFARALNDLGSFLLQRFDGDVARLVEAAESSAERLVEILAEMPFFADVGIYGEKQVPFYKRAQLTAADLATAFDGGGWGSFRDLDQLTIFADNLVPHVLRIDGVLRYEAPLLQRIERGELVTAGSPEEVEIRACALHAVELIAQQASHMGRSVNPMMLDYTLWNRGQGPGYKAHPRHRTRTVYY